MWTQYTQCIGAAVLISLLQGTSTAFAKTHRPDWAPKPAPVTILPALPETGFAPSSHPLATDDPGLALPRAPLTPDRLLGQPPDQPPSPTVDTTAPEGAVLIQTIRVEGSTVFSQAELQQVLAPFIGQSLTIRDLQAVADAITQLYLNGGYLTSNAFLPEQDIQNGQVQLRVLEGGIDQIVVVGSDRLTPYVQRRVTLADLQPVNQIALENQLRLLQLDPLFENVEASLRQGQTLNSSTLVVRVTEAPPISGSLAIDTLSPPSVGDFRTGATLQYLNPTGLGDRLLASAYRSTTGGSNAYELAYQVPLNPMNGTLLLRATPSDYRITDPDLPTFDLGLQGSTDQYEIQYRQPLIRSLEEEFALSLGFRYRNGSTLISGFITPPTITSVVEFGQDYLKRDPQGVWGVRSQLRLGTGLFEATRQAGDQPDGQFFSWLGQVQRWQRFSPDSQMLIQGKLQLTPDSLLGSEQFFLGGAQSVRGYYQNQRFADNGLSLSLEHQFTLQREQDGRPLLKLNPFLDLGYGWNSRAEALVSNQNFLMGTGLGVELYPLEDLRTRIDFGIPLVRLDNVPGDPPAGLRVYFDIRFQY